MEDSLGLDTKHVERIFLHKKFEEICPYFISIGMTYEQFWQGEATMTRDYLKANQIKQKNETIRNKWAIWEQGLYIYEALCDVSPILRAFSKVQKPQPYPKEPYNIKEIMKEYGYETNEESEEEKEKKLEKEKEIQLLRTQIFFENWARATKKHFEGKEIKNG